MLAVKPSLSTKTTNKIFLLSNNSPPINSAQEKHVEQCAFSPDTMFIYADGAVDIKPIHQDGTPEKFKPPDSPMQHQDSVSDLVKVW